MLNDRDNIIVLVDEAHRTQEGSLGDDMREALPNARFFGLTGTPIADEDRNTFKLFGDPDDPGYVLNTYSMERSIADGASVPDPRRDPAGRLPPRQDGARRGLRRDGRRGGPLRRGAGAARGARRRTSRRSCSTLTASRRCARDIVDHYHAKVAPLGHEGPGRRVRPRAVSSPTTTELTRLLAERGQDARGRRRHDRGHRQGRAAGVASVRARAAPTRRPGSSSGSTTQRTRCGS